MCGIIGYIGGKEAYNVLVKGLKRLEYRGYDSAGTAIISGKKLNVNKVVGRVEKLGTDGKKFPGKTGIAHTRWAIERFNNNKCSLDLKHTKTEENPMNILNLVQKEKYYALINKSFQKFLDSKIEDNKNILHKIKTSRMTLHRIRKHDGYWCNLNTLLNLTKLLEIKKSELIKNISKIKTKNSFPITIPNIKINDSLGRILGHILGDGGIHIIKREGKYRAFYVNNEEKLLNTFKFDVEKIFGEKSLYFRKRENHGDEIWLFSTLGYILYKMLEYDKNTKKMVPDWIKKSTNKKFIGSFLQALYDDDGYLYPKKKMVVISLVNPNLLNDIRVLVSKLGIKPNQVLIHQAKNRSKMYYFSITSKKNLIIFKKNIDFLHPVKKEKLNKLLNSYK